jgi:integrase
VRNYLTQEELLKYALSNGMINLDEVSEKANMDIITKIDEIHNYKITLLNGEVDRRWQTYVTDESKKTGKKLIKAVTKEKIYSKLAEYYGITENPNGRNMEDVFDQWIPYKRSITNSENTIYRHINHWRRYCKGNPISITPMKNLTTMNLEEWANNLIKSNNMTRKEWQNIKTVISGIWDYAYRSGYISQNSWSAIKISVKFRQINKRPPETQVFIGDNLDKLTNECFNLYERTENEAYLAIVFNLYCGLRVGELVAIKLKDINLDEFYMSIEREETHIRTRHRDNSISYEWKIEEHTKTYTNRYVPLIPKAINILEFIMSKNGEYSTTDRYLFTKEGSHLNTNQISVALGHACRQAGVSQKSTHKIRKTFASKLNAGGVPIDEIRVLLGHTDAQTTLGYVYNPLPKSETLDMIQKAL